MSASTAPAQRTPRPSKATHRRPKLRPAPTPPAERHAHSHHGRRLAQAFAELERLPALSEAREQLLSLTEAPSAASSEMSAVVESDAALALGVMRLANAGRLSLERVDTAAAAIERIGRDGARELALQTRDFGFFERGSWDLAPQRFRLHGLATQRAADRIATEIFHPNRDRIALTSLVHDVGKLVLMRAYPGYPAQVHRGAVLPEERLQAERRELGVDHALVGGVLLRRWGLPASITGAVERHHAPDATGEAALIRLADMLAHYQGGGRIAPAEMLRSARALDLGPKDLRRLLYALPGAPAGRPRAADPCPLSGRELRVLQRLSEGGVYKEIALELNLSASTVRSHLNKVYRKLGARDRAQAVLIASRQGWL